MYFGLRHFFAQKCAPPLVGWVVAHLGGTEVFLFMIFIIYCLDEERPSAPSPVYNKLATHSAAQITYTL